ncbi:substrate-binding domain-containing protein [Dactylosporangium sp. CS-047395]|uniref:substrate-binding domain-containing protein n=1 Tax=Dactylosporangium sp. CS-047395 TaxID=3239936 RepID=UPI003D91693A
MRTRGIVLVLALLVSAFALASPAAAANVYVPVTGAGSTLAGDAVQLTSVNLAQYGLRVNYQRTGSGNGRRSFAAGVVDWAASDVPYGVEPDQLPARGYTYAPLTGVGTTLMYNLTAGGRRVTNLRLSGDTIARIFTGVVTHWDDPAIAADNPGLVLPATPIVPVVRSDAAGSTYNFTRWLLARHGALWTQYCGCDGPRVAYPVRTPWMVAVPGDTGIGGYVSQEGADGTIGYVENPNAAPYGFPVAKVLNAAGYYTAPTAGHVGIALLKAKVGADQIADLSDVYTNPDPRSYELSWYTSLILPTDTTAGMTENKGYTLADFVGYLLCRGQDRLDALGYAPLPMNLAQAGFSQLSRIPGSRQPGGAFPQSCAGNPTFSSDGTDLLSQNDPAPPACDRQGASPCTVLATTTTVTGPSRAAANRGALLSATVTPPDAAGSIQFLAVGPGGSPLGEPVPVVGGAAQTRGYVGFGLNLGTNTIVARFTPSDQGAYTPSTSDPITVVVDGSEEQQYAEVDVPHEEGVLTVTVSSDPVRLTDAVLRPDHTFEASGALGAVTIVDERDQTSPGWTVTGQIGDFSDGARSFGGAHLGWTPKVLLNNPSGSAVAGSPVAPGTPRLPSGDVLAVAPAAGGLGRTTIGADLFLKIPSRTQPGLYAATLTITVLATG